MSSGASLLIDCLHKCIPPVAKISHYWTSVCDSAHSRQLTNIYRTRRIKVFDLGSIIRLIQVSLIDSFSKYYAPSTSRE